MKHTLNHEVLDGSLVDTKEHAVPESLKKTDPEIVLPAAAETKQKIHALIPETKAPSRELMENREKKTWEDKDLEAKWMKERQMEFAAKEEKEKAARNDPKKKALSAQAKKNFEQSQLAREKESREDPLNVLPPKEKERKAPWYTRFWNWLTRQK